MTSELQDGSDSLTDDPLFEALAARSRRTNINRAEQMLGVLADCRRQGEAGSEDVSRLADLAHQVVGSAGTFGFAPVSQLGRDVEAVLVRAELDADDLAELDRLTTAMLAELEPR